MALYPNLPVPLSADERGNYRLALVLGSGGPRGFAHVGVLVALDRLGIRPDLIVGTSMGAAIGALYASGMPLPAIWQRVMDSGFGDWLPDLTLHHFGWLTGETIEREIDRAVGGRPIEALPVRFVAVATRVPSGVRTEFARGNVGTAVRASSSVFGQIVPVQIGEHAYSDGDLVSPVPVETARRLGARHVIAVDVSADLRDSPDWTQIRSHWVSTGIYREQIIVRELAQADVPIRVRMNYYAYGDQNYKAYARAMGMAAVEAALPKLRALGLVNDDRP